MTNNLEDEIREVLAQMEQGEDKQEQQAHPPTPTDEIQDIYVLIVREHEEVEGDQNKVVDSTAVLPENPQIVDSKPLMPQQPPPFDYVTPCIVLLCSLPMLASILLQVYLLLNPPIATITIIPKSQTVTLTGTLQLGRLLQPITISQSQTVPTTGKGHQDARAATGELTFYNGSNRAQTINAGTVFTGNDGVQVATDEIVTIPPNNPPVNGQATVAAHALVANAQGNIAADDINFALSTDLTVKNLTAFTGGQDERYFSTVSQQDINKLSIPLKISLAQSMQGALAAQAKQNETISPLSCTTTVTSDHQPGEEATQVKVTVSETCSAIAYNQDTLQTKVTQLLTTQAATKLGAGYSLISQVLVSIQNATVANSSRVFLSFHAQGTWVYGIGNMEQQYIKRLIAGKTKQEALQLLLSLPGVKHITIHFAGFGDDTKIPKNPRNIHLLLNYEPV